LRKRSNRLRNFALLVARFAKPVEQYVEGERTKIAKRAGVLRVGNVHFVLHAFRRELRARLHAGSVSYYFRRTFVSIGGKSVSGHWYAGDLGPSAGIATDFCGFCGATIVGLSCLTTALNLSTKAEHEGDVKAAFELPVIPRRTDALRRRR
jgi:hypothetical protein